MAPVVDEGRRRLWANEGTVAFPQVRGREKTSHNRGERRDEGWPVPLNSVKRFSHGSALRCCAVVQGRLGSSGGVQAEVLAELIQCAMLERVAMNPPSSMAEADRREEELMVRNGHSYHWTGKGAQIRP
eukprot:Sspe_Gene.10424::Locus_3485_Transcript_1_1_Confidence_1.000_Length_555::g.10424::m.10424